MTKFSCDNVSNRHCRACSLSIMLEKVTVFSVFQSQTLCVHATWSLYVRTEPSVCFSPWFVMGSNTVKTDLMRTLSMLDVVRNPHIPLLNHCTVFLKVSFLSFKLYFMIS